MIDLLDYIHKKIYIDKEESVEWNDPTKNKELAEILLRMRVYTIVYEELVFPTNKSSDYLYKNSDEIE